MSQVPLNQRLWNCLVIQAKGKFRKWPSIPAGRWVHQQYVHHGGQFADAKSVTAAKKRAKDASDRNKTAKKTSRKDDDD
jgi:hypothetical protein